MRRVPGLLLSAGEGALAGLVAGGALGGWEVRLNQDLAHGTPWLAAIRLVSPLAMGAITGGALSVLLAGALDLASAFAARARRGVAVLLLLAAAAAGAAIAGPLRERCFPLRHLSSARLSIGIIGLVLAAGLALVIARIAGAPSAEASRGGGVRPGARVRRILGSLGLTGALVALAARTIVPRLAESRASGRPSVILVCFDTLRADRLGALGSQRPTTPHLDALAAEGALFEQATSCAPWTLPSHVSLFTSRLPFDHGVRWTSSYIHPERSMLAERFRDAGYRTAAFTGDAYVASSFGFDQGFEVYEDHDEAAEGGPEKIAGAALGWISRHASEPFFVFIHTYEPHTPYRRRQFARQDDAGRLGPSFEFKDVEAVQEGKLVLTESERRYVSDLYDGDVAHADQVIGTMLDLVRLQGILDEAILVVLSDHGEDLWDHEVHRSPGHGHSLYQELLRVPLIVRAPGRVRAGVRVRTPVSLLDVAPTLLALAGLAPDPEHQGKSLAASLEAGTEPAAERILSESVEYGPDRLAVREGSRKVIVTPFPDKVRGDVHLAVKPVEIFDLDADPHEKNDLGGGATRTEPSPGGAGDERPGMIGSPHLGSAAGSERDALLIAVLEERARRVLRLYFEEPRGARPLSPEMIERLRSLGYVK